MRQQLTNRDIEWLWDLLPKPHGIVRWFARNADSSEIAGDFADSARSLVGAAHAYKHLNFYVQPNPTGQRTKLRSSAKDVTHWSYLLIDIDPIPGVLSSPVGALQYALSTLGWWQATDIKPLILDSGRGMQAWVRLEDVPVSTPSLDGGLTHYGARVAANFALKYLDNALITEGARAGQSIVGLHGCRVDVSCSDLPRLMRCPGTVNIKTGRRAVLLESGVVHKHLHTWLLNKVPHEDLIPRVIVPQPGRKWQQVVSKLTMTAALCLKEGTTEPGRHKTFSATLKSLQENGICADNALAALIEANRKTVPPLDLPELERMVAAQYRELDTGA